MNEKTSVGYTKDGLIFLAINTMYEDKPVQTIMQMPPGDAVHLAKMLIQVAEDRGWEVNKDGRNGSNPN
jgi:hypothetical protein